MLASGTNEERAPVGWPVTTVTAPLGVTRQIKDPPRWTLLQLKPNSVLPI